MKKIGMLTGISYVSGIDYYKSINQKIAQLVPRGSKMAKNSIMTIVSVDCDTYVTLLENHDFDGVSIYLCNAVEEIVRAGVDFLIIASNTGHICVPDIHRRFPTLPVLHIADCVAQEITKNGFTKIGLLGTKPTMKENYLKKQLSKHGITTIIPETEEEQQAVYDIICQELSFDIFRPESRNFLIGLIQMLVTKKGAEGVLLGCTELELLVLPEHIPGIPIFRSAEIHIQAAALVQAGLKQVEDYMPVEDKKK